MTSWHGVSVLQLATDDALRRHASGRKFARRQPGPRRLISHWQNTTNWVVLQGTIFPRSSALCLGILGIKCTNGISNMMWG